MSHEIEKAIFAGQAYGQRDPDAHCKCPACPKIDGKPDPDWEPPAHSFDPHALGCPKHRPIKQYCRIHYAGFYGHCIQCQYEDQPVVVHVQEEVEPRPAVDLDGSPAVSTEAPGETVASLIAQKQVIEAAIANELS